MDGLGEQRREDDEGDGPPMPSLAELEAGLARSREDIAAGRTEPLEAVLDRLTASAARVREARRRQG